MKTRRSMPVRQLGTALAVSAALALGACSSDDDDDPAPDPDTTVDPTDPDPDPDPDPDSDSDSDSDSDPDGGTGTPDGAEATVTVTSTLGTDQEIPALAVDAPDASGEGTLTVDTGTGAISGEVTVAGLTGPATMAHIHRGFAGNAGPVLQALDGSADGTTWTVPPGSVLDAAGLEAYARGELYFNVHTAENPSGEVRGQIVPEGTTTFTVRLENVSTDATLNVDDDLDPGTPPVTDFVPLSPGAFVVHRGDDSPLLLPLDAANAGLESVAEDGTPTPYVTGDTAIPGATVFDLPLDADMPGPIGPGGAYELVFSAVPGDKLGFVTMFVASNDWFYTPTDEDNSIELFAEDGTPVSGDLSEQIALWDAGTEVDELPGGDATTAPNQVRNQAEANTGPDEMIGVGSLTSMNKTVDLNGQVLRVTITPAAP